MNQDVIERLQLKNPAEAIIERVQHDFNLAPLVARTLFEQMRSYFESYYQLKNDSGQLTYLAVSATSPAGRKLSECHRVAVKLSLHIPDDLVALGRGVAALRQARLLRLTEEAYEQGGLLTHEDLACLLSPRKAEKESGSSVFRKEIIKERMLTVSIEIQILFAGILFLIGLTGLLMRRNINEGVRTLAPFLEFDADPYADYSVPWFKGHAELRGAGSWVTSPALARPTYRNFDTPERRDPFVGFRTAQRR